MLGQIVEDRYLVEAELGEGAMGRVYRARHVKVGRKVAIKVMHPELARVPTIVERFAREARIAARLDHPNLVSVLDVGMTADRLPLIVLELAPGRSLFEIAIEAMPRERVVNLVRQLLLGLDHAHAAGLVHRDLKPDNILVETRPDGTMVSRIVDFGIAVCKRTDDEIAGRRLTEANTVIGTPCYMSPEQAMAKELDARSDLFSLGVIMYELLAGMTPFPGSGAEVAYANASQDVPAIAERAGVMVDPLLEVFVRKLLARRLDERFQSAREAMIMLDLIESDRIAAARVLSGVGKAMTPVPVSACASNPHRVALPTDSDLLSTHSAPRVRRESKITKVEHVAVVGMRPSRKRAWMCAGLAVAAMTAIVGWSRGIGHESSPQRGAQPSIESSLVAAAPPTLTQPTLTTRTPTPTLTPALTKPTLTTPTVSPSASMIRVADEPTITRVATLTQGPLHVADVEPAGKPVVATIRTKGAAKPAAPHTMTAVAAAAPVAHAPVAAAVDAPVATPVVARVAAAPVAPATTATESESLAARYVAVGRLLRGAPDQLWARYRLIRINEALATEDARRQAFVALAEIERAIKR